MTASALKYDHDIIIIKSAKSLKLFSYEEIVGRSIEKKIANIIYGKSFQSFPMQRKKFSMLFLFNFVPQHILNFLFMFHLVELIASRFKH